jgi:hypothetical protein
MRTGQGACPVASFPAVVVLTAVLPTAIAQRYFSPAPAGQAAEQAGEPAAVIVVTDGD